MTTPKINATTKLAEAYAEVHNELITTVTELERKQLDLAAAAMPTIRRLVQKVATAEEKLRESVDGNRDSFVKPKTMTVAGIRFGLKKGVGGYVIEDEEAVIARIKKHLPEEDWDALIKTEESLKKAGLDGLEGGVLKKLGVEVQGDEEVVFVKPVDGKVSKAVNAMLKAARKEGADV
jgi:hypothetical protein